MKLTGYSDVWSVRPGESIGFHVHSEAERVDAQLVRLLHGDENPRGPGFREREIPSSTDGRHKAAPQQIYRGSFALLEAERPLLEERDFKLGLWIWPTLPRAGSQGLVSWRDKDTQGGLALALDEMGRVAARLGDRELIRSREALSPRAWVHIQLEAREGRVFLSVAPRDFSPRHALPDNSEAPLERRDAPIFGPRLVIACRGGRVRRRTIAAAWLFQRKDRPAPPCRGVGVAMCARLLRRTGKPQPDRSRAWARRAMLQSADPSDDRPVLWRAERSAGPADA